MKRSRNSSKKTINEMIKTPQMWIGILTLLVFLTLTIRTIPVQTEAKTTMCSLPHPLSSQPVPSYLTPTISPSKEKLYTVQQNDNFWNISKKTCGNGRFYLGIQKRNGYDNDWKALHVGETITILCEE